jgi:hypothetical protein
MIDYRFHRIDPYPSVSSSITRFFQADAPPLRRSATILPQQSIQYFGPLPVARIEQQVHMTTFTPPIIVIDSTNQSHPGPG